MATFQESAILRVVDNASAPLQRITQQLRTLHAAAAALDQRLKGMGSLAGLVGAGGGAGGASPQANRVRVADERIARNAEQVARNREVSSARVESQRRGLEERALRAQERLDVQRQIASAKIESRRHEMETRAAERSALRAETVGDRAFSRQARIAEAQERAAIQRQLASARVESRRRDLETRERARDQGYFGRFPENVPAIAARYAGWKTVQYTHDAARVMGAGLMQGNDQRQIDRLQALDPATRDDNWNIARAASQKFQSANTADLVEIARQARVQTQDPSQLNVIVESAAKLQTVATAVFGDAKKGADTAYKVMRIGIASGRIDDPRAFAQMTEEIGRSIVQSGKDVSPTLIESTFRQAGSLVKMGLGGKLDPTTGKLSHVQAIGDLVNLSDEERGRAADRIRTFTQDMMRPNLNKDSTAKMHAAGIRGADNVAVDKELLAADPFEWVQKHIAPKLIAAGVDLKDASAVQSALFGMGFLSSSANYAAMAINKRDEIRQERSGRAKFDLSDVNIQKMQSQHIRTGFAAVEAQLKNYSDGLLKHIEGPLAFVTGGAANVLNTMSRNPLTYTGGGLALGALVTAGVYAANNPEKAAVAAAAASQTAAGLGLQRAAVALNGAALRLSGAGAIGAAGGRFAVGPTSVPGVALGAGGAAAAVAAASRGKLGFMDKAFMGLGLFGAGSSALGGDYLGGSVQAAAALAFLKSQKAGMYGMAGAGVFEAGRSAVKGNWLDATVDAAAALAWLGGPKLGLAGMAVAAAYHMFKPASAASGAPGPAPPGTLAPASKFTPTDFNDPIKIAQAEIIALEDIASNQKRRAELIKQLTDLEGEKVKAAQDEERAKARSFLVERADYVAKKLATEEEKSRVADGFLTPQEQADKLARIPLPPTGEERDRINAILNAKEFADRQSRAMAKLRASSPEEKAAEAERIKTALRMADAAEAFYGRHVDKYGYMPADADEMKRQQAMAPRPISATSAELEKINADLLSAMGVIGPAVSGAIDASAANVESAVANGGNKAGGSMYESIVEAGNLAAEAMRVAVQAFQANTAPNPTLGR